MEPDERRVVVDVRWVCPEVRLNTLVDCIKAVLHGERCEVLFYILPYGGRFKTKAVKPGLREVEAIFPVG